MYLSYITVVEIKQRTNKATLTNSFNFGNYTYRSNNKQIYKIQLPVVIANNDKGMLTDKPQPQMLSTARLVQWWPQPGTASPTCGVEEGKSERNKRIKTPVPSLCWPETTALAIVTVLRGSLLLTTFIPKSTTFSSSRGLSSTTTVSCGIGRATMSCD